MKLILQAKSAGNPETWEPAYGILLGAQLGVAQNASTWDWRPVLGPQAAFASGNFCERHKGRS